MYRQLTLQQTQFKHSCRDQLFEDQKPSVSHISHRFPQQMTDYEQKLKMYKTAYTQLEHSFKNNLNVIQQLQQQNSQLHKHLQQVSAKYEAQLEKTLIEKQQNQRKLMEEQEIEFAREISLIKKQYEHFISTLTENEQNKSQQLLTALTKRHKQDIENLRNHLLKQIQTKQLQLKKTHSKNKSLEESLLSTQQKLNNLNLKHISLESDHQRLLKQRQQTQTLHSSKEQELESIKQYSTSWENTLRQRIKELQDQKSSLEEEMAEVRFAQRQKLKKVKDDHAKKITNLQETHAQRLNQTLHQSKQIKFKYETLKSQNTQLKAQTEFTKRELLDTKKLLQEERLRFSSVQDSILTLREKEFQIKSITEEVRRLQNQVKSLQDDKNAQKQEQQKINYQRENAEKALERLKTELLNKNRECDDYKKQLDRLRYKTKVNSYQPQTLEQVSTQAKGLARYEQKDAVKGGEVDYSKCFSDDMGGEDFKFLSSQIQSSPQKSPYGQQESMQQQNQQNFEGQTSKISQLMRRVGELQVENQEYGSTIRLLKEEMERTAGTISERMELKEQEIRLGKNENMLLREKLNDREQQLMRVKGEVREMREQIEKANVGKQSLEQMAQIKLEKEKLSEQNKRLLTQVQRLNQDLADAIKERQTLEEIADGLRAEVNFYKDQVSYMQQDRGSNFAASQIKNQGSAYYQSNASNQYSQYTQSNQDEQKHKNYQDEQKNKNYQNPTHIKPQNNTKMTPNRLSSQIQPNFHQNRHQSRSKSPQNQKPQPGTKPKRKLHELIKQKNQLQAEGALVMGRKANLERRAQQERAEHMGTKSQKQIYEKIQKRSKSKSKQKPMTRLKDFQLSKAQKQESSRPEKRQSYQNPLPDSILHQQVSHTSEASQQMIDHSALMKRIEMMNKMKQSMGKDSLGEFDHLENVSMTYWDQQEQY